MPLDEPVPLTLTRSQVRRFYGLGPAEIEQIFRLLPVVHLAGRQKTRVRRSDLDAHLDAHTYVDGRQVRRVG
jgi:hypothetical protein